MTDEIIIAVPRKKIQFLLDKQPFGFFDEKSSQMYDLILNSCTEVNRASAENDESFKQIIPYILITYQEKYLLLKRKTKQTEARLHNKMSIGVGGHINPIDYNKEKDIILGGLLRELHEEVRIVSFEPPVFLGFINDDISEVGKVHLGLLFRVESHTSDVDVIEIDKMDGQWASISELNENFDYLESWSQIAFNSCIK
ncbi:DNA mismatch repair protein MutT [Spirosoma sp. KUDC1026]|uniref:DNA mismatch repair protein MutT n=1 Tax=Spirosoma sp. KUDC1026 TaxID=2745947 RepID=UPI00159BB023|nr:DNA mismatch repair protein MutT [Spirosoma sp. KUDC1026]QKZ15096.1 DNA mismatch repair protein MutT [Spirosoma sp. KUDC1026]